MQLTVDLDADVYDFASAYAGAKRLTLSQALSELVRRADKAQEPEGGSSRLRMNEYGYYEIVATGEPLTVEMVKEASEDELI
jgi:hypothetical protein